MSLLDANILSSSIFLITSVPILWIGLFFYYKPDNNKELKSILHWLFLSWGTHYVIVGSQILYQVVAGHIFFTQSTMRMISSVCVLIEFSALIRMYVYIKNSND